MKKFKVFISSTQKELRTERIAVQEVIAETEILSRYFEVEIFEELPPMGIPAQKGAIESLKLCDVYIGIFGNEYSKPTAEEYHAAKSENKYILIFLKGKSDEQRDHRLLELLKEFKGHKGFTYKRFEDDYTVLKKWVSKGLKHFLEKEKGIKLSLEDKTSLELPKTSYDMRPVRNASIDDLSMEAVRCFFNTTGTKIVKKSIKEVYPILQKRGLIHKESREDRFTPTISGLLLFGKSPETLLVQSKIKADRFQGTEPVNTIDYQIIKGSLPQMWERAKEFFLKNIRTAMTIEGFSRVLIEEYPEEAFREAVINAMVHRDYEIKGATIMINMFSDRMVIASPGLLPSPLTLEDIRKFKYRPVSRNPIIARTMLEMGFIEERGGGIRRMHNMMINYGLKPPEFAYDTGYFTVTFYGPGEKILELHPIKPRIVYSIEEVKLAELNDRQKGILKHLLEHGRITSLECTEKFKITRDTANRDFKKLMKLRLIEQKGTGRGTYYILK